MQVAKSEENIANRQIISGNINCTALNVTLMLASLSFCHVSFAARIRYLSLETAKKSLDKYAMHTYG